MRASAERLAVAHEGNVIRFTISVGVVSLASTSLSTLVDHADRAMYEAKRAGCNQVRCATAAA